MSLVELRIERTDFAITLGAPAGIGCSGRSRIDWVVGEEWPGFGAPWPAFLTPGEPPVHCEWHIVPASLLDLPGHDDSLDSLLLGGMPRFAEFVEAHRDEICIGLEVEEDEPKRPRSGSEYTSEDAAETMAIITMPLALFDRCMEQMSRLQATPGACARVIWVVDTFPTAEERQRATLEDLTAHDLHFDPESRKMFAYRTGATFLFDRDRQ
jgi:hypothetical protein